MLGLIILFRTYLHVTGEMLLEKLSDASVDIQLFFQYDLYEFWAGLTYENMEVYLVLLIYYLVLQALAFYICVRFDFDFDKFHDYLDSGHTTPAATLHNFEDAAEKGLSHTADMSTVSIAVPSSAPSPLPTHPTPAFPFKHFRATGDSFLPHNRYDLKKGQTTYPSLWKDTFLKEEEETKHGFQRLPKAGCANEWKYLGPTDDKKIAASSTIKEPGELQHIVEVEPESAEKVVATRPTDEVADPPTKSMPSPTTVSTLSAISAASQAVSSAPAIPSNSSPTILPLPRPVSVQPLQIIELPPPPPNFQMVYQALFMKVDGLKNAIDAFVFVVRGSGDASNTMLFLCKSFDLAYQELRLHRNQLTLNESRMFGWDSPILAFYQFLHSNGYELVAHYNNDMLIFILAVAKFGRYLGLQLPDPDLSPPEPLQPPPQLLQPPAQLLHPKSQPPSQPLSQPPPQLPSMPQVPPPMPPPMPQVPPGLTMPQHTSPTKPTESTQAPPTPSGKAPQMAPKAPSESPMQPVAKIMNFDSQDDWTKKSEEELNALTWKSFGWTDEASAKKKIWTFSARSDFALHGSAEAWKSAIWVRRVLLSKVWVFKRAAVVLRMQAGLEDYGDPASAPLVKEMTEFFKQAEKMTDSCNFKATLLWNDTCLYFHDNVYAEDEVYEALRRQHPNDYDDLRKQWEIIEKKWNVRTDY